MKKTAVSPNIDEKLYKDVFKFVLKRVSSVEDAEDIVQEVFIRFIQKGPVEDQPIVGWVYRVARNASIDHYRSNSRRKRESFVEHSFPDFVDKKVESEVANCLIPLLGEMSEEERELISRIDLGGGSQKDLSDELAIPYPTLKSRLQRARKKLKNSLVQCCQISLSKNGYPKSCTDRNSQCC